MSFQILEDPPEYEELQIQTSENKRILIDEFTDKVLSGDVIKLNERQTRSIKNLIIQYRSKYRISNVYNRLVYLLKERLKSIELISIIDNFSRKVAVKRILRTVTRDMLNRHIAYKKQFDSKWKYKVTRTRSYMQYQYSKRILNDLKRIIITGKNVYGWRGARAWKNILQRMKNFINKDNEFYLLSYNTN